MTAAGRAVVSGMICAQPNQGGATWAVMQFVLGLRRLGWTVHFVETIDRTAVMPAGAPLDVSDNAAYLAATMSAFGLEGSWSLLTRGGGEAAGVSRAELKKTFSEADLLLNISGRLKEPDLLAGPETRVYVDLDPGFTQLWHETQGIDVGLDGHDCFVTVGQNIGLPGCPIPTCGRLWTGIAPPVVLAHWPEQGASPRPEMTTVGHWRGYGSIRHGGVHYGQRAHSMRRLMTLPRLTDQAFRLALAIHSDESDDIEALDTNGWLRVNPRSVAYDMWSYRRFVRDSRAELSVPKSGYVASRSAWFSDRSACYLASGRPVVAMSTGFESHLPAGKGLLAFGDVFEAAECIAAVNADYSGHSAAARAVAMEYLDSDRVLSRMLESIGSMAAPAC